MPQHNFLFHPSKEELPNYIAAIEKVEALDQFRGQVAVDLQLHQGQWTGELSALTSRKMMAFITEIYMELPPEAAKEDEEFQLTSDGPEEVALYFDKESQSVVEGVPVQTEQSSSDEEDEEYEQTDEEYEHEEDPLIRPAGQQRPKKLKKPTGVVKTGNSAITVEED